MKKLLYYGDLYAKNSTWKDFALVKFCLFSIGLALGCAMPERKKKFAVCAALAVFLGTYIPLMAKWASLVSSEKRRKIT